MIVAAGAELARFAFRPWQHFMAERVSWSFPSLLSASLDAELGVQSLFAALP